MTFTFGETVTYKTPAAPVVPAAWDEAGNPILGSPGSGSLVNVGVAPLAADETAEPFGPRSVTGYLLLLPYGTTIPANAYAVNVRGEDFVAESGSVDSDWRSPFTDWEAGTTLTVRRAS